MEMCPYCGEDIPAESKSCWKCGVELTPGDGDESPTPDGPVQERARAAGPRECPYCGTEVARKALRCNECGRMLEEVQAKRSWIPAVYSAFALVVLGVLVGVLYLFLSSRKPTPDPGRERPVEADYGQLRRIYLTGSGREERKQKLWGERHAGKYVEWEVVIVSIEKDALRVTCGDGETRGEAVVMLDDVKEIEAHRLKPDKMFKVNARLDSFKDGVFYLSRGQVVTDETPPPTAPPTGG